MKTHGPRAHRLEGRKAFYVGHDGKRVDGRLRFDDRPFQKTWRLEEVGGEEHEIDDDAVRVLDPSVDGALRIPRFEESHVFVGVGRLGKYKLAEPRKW